MREAEWEIVVRKLKAQEARQAEREAARQKAAIGIAEAALRHRRLATSLYADYLRVAEAVDAYNRALDAYEAVR